MIRTPDRTRLRWSKACERTSKANRTRKEADMQTTHVLTLREAAEQTGLALDTILKIADAHTGVVAVNDDITRVDPWALDAVLADEDFKQAA
mmetsp:Transcript_95248/g.132320  ORF Transcript_95248/g.132320 Transcript_95248/m.132320 type:complete len:92 (+) Transcript_95248:73-348(+)